jgi:hypothetical protein
VLREGCPVPCLRLLDISERGAGLLLECPVRPGETLQLTLTNLDLPGSHPASLRVTRCTAARDGFVAGGAFAEPLPPDAWDSVLA